MLKHTDNRNDVINRIDELNVDYAITISGNFHAILLEFS